MNLPSVLSRTRIPHGNGWRIRVVGNYAYLTLDESWAPLVICDISVPAAPTIEGRWTDYATGGYFTGLEVSADGNSAFVGHVGRISTVDCTTKTAPTESAVWSSGVTPSRLEILRDGNTLYVACAQRGLYALDATNPLALSQTSLLVQDAAGAGVGETGVDTNRLYMSSNIATIGASKYLVVFGVNYSWLVDVTDPAAMSIAYTWDLTINAGSTPAWQSAYLTSTRLYVFGGKPDDTGPDMDRLFIFDITTPTAPVLLNDADGYQIEPKGMDCAENVVGPTTYLLVGCAYSATPKTIDGVAGSYSGRAVLALNVTDPATISVAGTLDAQRLTAPPNGYQGYQRMLVSGNTLYGATYYRGLDIVNVTDPTALARLGYRQVSGEGRWLELSGNDLLAGSSMGGINVVDVSSPLAPSVNAVPLWMGSRSAYQWSHCRKTNTVYWTPATENGTFMVWDVSTPTAPAYVSAINPDINMPISMTMDRAGGDYLLVGGKGTGVPAFQIYDVSTPAAPVAKGYASCAAGTQSDCAIMAGNTVFVGTRSGVYIYDVTDKDNPAYTTVLAAPLGVNGLVFWSTGGVDYLYVSTREAYMAVGADTYEGGGLFVYNVTNPAAPTVLLHLYEDDMGSTAVQCEALYRMGSVLLLADYFDSVHCFNLTNPAVPVYAGDLAESYVAGIVASASALYVMRIGELLVCSLPIVPTVGGSPYRAAHGGAGTHLGGRTRGGGAK